MAPVLARTADAAPSVVVALPTPSGPSRVGVVDLHLVDGTRADPLTGSTRRRELMVTVWYPATNAAATTLRAWMTSGLLRTSQTRLAGIGIPAAGWTLASSHGHRDAAADISGGRRPVLLYSPGFGASRSMATAQIEDLASHGFVVVAMDHPGYEGVVEFPDGRIEAAPKRNGSTPRAVLIDTALAIRVADTRFVLDSLGGMVAGRQLDADRHRLPANLSQVLDLSRVGMFGHSLGGATAAAVMRVDRRVRAGVNLDGTLYGDSDGTVAGPFLLISSTKHNRPDDRTWQQFWDANPGRVVDVRLVGAMHNSFNDFQVIMPRLVSAGLVAGSVAAKLDGTIDPTDSVDATWLPALLLRRSIPTGRRLGGHAVATAALGDGAGLIRVRLGTAGQSSGGATSAAMAA